MIVEDLIVESGVVVLTLKYLEEETWNYELVWVRGKSISNTLSSFIFTPNF